ncbi:RagB/SusD family nutrient uptake outer membrane protein [Draconibacterium orientale]|uniref:RagB/SusD family nutrient uptake outer membrane protein n=1 Tax=Draconibacterium orientale TaxID=1168034 RepID=UPI0029C09C90|nr:RagB/SusD family nutrient uptake outer membrane protein [Draconibacterium orientale]
MIIKKFKYLSIIVLAALLAITSCTNDLDTVPIDKDVVTSESVYENPNNYINVLAKLYAGLAVSGQQGPSGNNDLSGLDEGFGQYLRAYWYAQELPTDEAVIGWNDATLRDFHDMDWSADDGFITNLYYRIFYQVSLCNEFIRETTAGKLDGRGIDGAMRTDIELYRAEARFLRALSYYHAVDLFGSVPFVTEEDNVGAFFPEQISRTDLFNYVESELLAVENELSAPGSAEYGRADQATVWMVLAKMYLNAEVYTGTARYSDALNYSEKVINAGYSLDPEYTHMFLADNHTSSETIFPIIQDGTNIRTWGGTTFLVHAPVGGTMDPDEFGIDGGWSGLRTTKEFVGKFLDLETLAPKLKSANATADYPVIYVPGGYQVAAGYSESDWSPDVAPTLASVNSDDNYEGYVYFAEAGEFKFTAGPNWDLNWGDDGGDGSLEPNGQNLSVDEAGYYKINVNTVDGTYSIMKTDWGIIGSATAGGWDSDQNMEFDADSKTWVAEIDLAAGEIKFRANDGWDLNYGDDGADGILEGGAANIAIAEGGSYKITMKLGTPDYTYTVEKFSSDGRALFFTDGQTLEIDNLFEFTNGYAITKWKNVTSTGETGSDLTHPDTDFPMFRLADAYLMYAEAVLRGGGGSMSTALSYVNELRERAYGDDFGNMTEADLTLDFILDERARELYWEGHRRTDLIRFGKFTGSDYVWAWKGAVKEGIGVDAKYNTYPLPSSDVSANPNLTQTTGY